MSLVVRIPNAPQNYDAQNEAQFRNMMRQALTDASSPIILEAGVGESFAGVNGDVLVNNGSAFVASTTLNGALTFSGITNFTASAQFISIDVNGGAIDGTPIGATSPASGAFTTLNATGGGSLTGTWTDLGIVTTVDINGGTLDGVTIGGAAAAAGTFTTLNATGGGALTGTWTDLGSVTTIDINGGTIDGTTIGGAAAAAGTFTTLNATGGGALTGTWTDLGTVTTVDIDGGTLDGSVIGGASAAAGTFTTLTATTVVLGDDAQLQFGAGTDYWFEYDSTATAFQLWSTDVDGAAADGRIFEVQDGTDDITFFGVLRGPNGSSVAPTWGFTNDTDSGLRLESAGIVRLSAGSDTTYLEVRSSDGTIRGNQPLYLTNNATVFHRMTNTNNTDLSWDMQIATTSGDFEIRSTTDVGTTTQLAISIDHASGDFTVNQRLNLVTGIALGGGAAPTLGTIGGSGPTTAAQAQWVEIDISGTAHWIAVWT